MKTLDVSGLEPAQVSDLIETHMGWRPTCKIGRGPYSWNPDHVAIMLTDRSIPITALRKLINYDFSIEGQLFSLSDCSGKTCEDHGSGYPGDTGTTYIPEILFVYEPA